MNKIKFRQLDFHIGLQTVVTFNFIDTNSFKEKTITL